MINGSLNVFAILCALTAAIPCAGASASYRVIYALTGQTTAAIGIIEGSPGVFFSSSPSAVFWVNTQGTETTVATIQDPPYILATTAGVPASNGLVYSSFEEVKGMGSGNIFSVSSAPGSEQIYPAQRLAASPLAGTLPNGKLFGLAYGFTVGPWFLGTADLTGKVVSFYQFPSPNERPGTPVYGADGNYYGISWNSGIAGSKSYFYRVTPSGSFTQIASLPFAGAAGAYSGSGLLLQGTDGNFYGIQQTDGGCSSTNQHGAVYKLTPAGQFTILHDFGVCGPAIIDTLIQGSDGKLYGATEGNNLIFSLTTSGAYNVVFQTNNHSMQGLCTCTLVQGSDGILYGTAAGGGPNAAGVIFALDAGLPIPNPRARRFHPESGSVGTQVRIWGYDLFGASVQFNGISATGVHNGGSNYVWATVPPGATTGPITVTTPGGSSTTKVNFTVQ